MLYRNLKTGAEIEAKCPISGGDWILIQEKKPKRQSVPKSGTAAKRTKKELSNHA